MRTARWLAALSLVIVADCSDRSLPTAPREHRPSFSYTATAGAAVILGAYPSSSNYTIAYGINDFGAISGVSGITNAVRWETGTAAAPASTTALLVANTGAIGRDINEAGQVAGEDNGKAALFTPNGGGGYTVTDIGSLLSGAVVSAAYGINASGQVVGNYFDGSVSKCFLWTPSAPNATTGSVVTLSDLGGNFCVGNDINSFGQIAGSSTVPASGPLHAVVWGSALVPTDLLPGPDESYGSAINDAGQIAGYHTSPTGPTSAALWTPTSSTWTLADLPAPALSGQTGVITSAALDVNDAGFIVGYTSGGSIVRAFFWQNGTFTELADPGPDVVEATAMTNLVGSQVIVTGADVFDQVNNYRHGLRWSVTLTPTSLQGCLAELAQLVTQLREGAVLNPGEANSLLAKVDAASRQASQGKTTPAKNLLNALINEVNAMRASGRLSSADAQALIDAAQCAIAAL